MRVQLITSFILLYITERVLSLDKIYEDCGKRKLCTFVPSECLLKKSCEGIAAYIYKDNRISFELYAKNPSNYIAIGFSTDNLMGDDAVVQCFGDKIVMSENQGKSNSPLDDQTPLGNKSNEITHRLECTFTLPLQFKANALDIDFVTKQYFIFTAYGVVRNDVIQQHEAWTRSTESVNVSSLDAISVDSTPQLRFLHKFGMIFTFNFFMPVGTFISRFYKETWSHKRYYKRRLWFILHISCMIAALVFAIIAYILIALTENTNVAWYFPTPTQNAFLHNIVGIAALVLLVLQTTTHWWHSSNSFLVGIGQILHYLTGSVCYILGMVNIAFTEELIPPNKNLDKKLEARLRRYKYIILAWIIIHAGFYIFMTVYTTWTDWHIQNGGLRALLGYPMPIASGEEAPRPEFRRIILIIFTSVALTMTVCCILVTDEWKLFRND